MSGFALLQRACGRGETGLQHVVLSGAGPSFTFFLQLGTLVVGCAGNKTELQYGRWVSLCEKHGVDTVGDGSVAGSRMRGIAADFWEETGCETGGGAFEAAKGGGGA